MQPTGAKDNAEVETGKIFRSACLATTKLFNRHEILQVLMVYDDLYKENGSLELKAPFFESTYNRKQFFVVDFVVDLLRRMLLGKECNRA
jgi:hypothetical protein